MTWTRYRRLLAVLVVPLLGLGMFLFAVVIPPPNYASMLCSPFLTGDQCRTTDGLGGPWDDQLRREHAAWFNVYTRSYEQNRWPHTIVSGSSRRLNTVHIIDVKPYVGTDERPGSPLDRLRSLEGSSISIDFGVLENRERLLNPLGCNELTFDEDREFYTAGLCGIEGGVALVKFTLGNEDRASLDELRQVIDRETASARHQLNLHYLLGIPIPLILFVGISALIWMVRRAIGYVSAG